MLFLTLQIEKSSDFNDTVIEHAELLEKAGFTSVLNENTKLSAVDAIKEYNMFYRILGPLRQLMKGKTCISIHEYNNLETIFCLNV